MVFEEGARGEIKWQFDHKIIFGAEIWLKGVISTKKVEFLDNFSQFWCLNTPPPPRTIIFFSSSDHTVCSIEGFEGFSW